MPHKTLDPAQLESWRELLSGTEGTSFIRELIDGFLSESATQLAALQAALHARDTATCHSLAHRLQGMCSVIGARHLADLSAELEVLAQTAPLARLGEQFVQMQEEYARVTQALEQERP